jgi:hypothetical protein
MWPDVQSAIAKNTLLVLPEQTMRALREAVSSGVARAGRAMEEVAVRWLASQIGNIAYVTSRSTSRHPVAGGESILVFDDHARLLCGYAVP